MDTNMLKSILVRNGDNVAALAEKMGLSTAGLYRRLDGKTQFTYKELKAIKDIYGLSADEIDAIFFTNGVS